MDKVINLFMLNIIGQTGSVLIVGVAFFIIGFKNSERIFDWIKDKTYGTRDFIKQKSEFLHWEIRNEDHIVYVLIALFFGLPFFIFSTFILFGHLKFGIFIFISFVFIGLKIPRPFMNYLVSKRISRYEGQMIDALNLLTNGIRAGLSLPQAFGMVVEEMPAPVSQEFNLVLQQNKIGSPLEECLDDFVKRMPTEDNKMFVSAINILRETGGNLAETFDTIVEIIRERIRLKQKIDTYTAQGMTQATVAFLMPFFIGILFFFTDPETMGRVFAHPLGIALLGVALALDIIGAFVILKVVKIKV